MTKLIGQIEEKIIKEGKTNDKIWKRCSYKIAGKTFSTFDSKLMEFTKGDRVEVEYTEDGMYNNIVNIQNASVTTESPGDHKEYYLGVDLASQPSIMDNTVIKKGKFKISILVEEV